MLARLPRTARSCRAAHPCRSSGPISRAVRRSPAAPRRQATASGLGRNRSAQPATRAASAPRASPSRDASRLPRTPPPTPTPRMTATRQGRVRTHAAHSAARICRHLAWAEPPGWPTVARTRTATTGRPASVLASSSSGSSARRARMAWRSAGLSGRTDPLGRSSSSKGHGRDLAIRSAPSSVGLAGGPLRASPTTLLARTWVAGALADRWALMGGVGSPLLGLDALDGRLDLPPVGPLGSVVRLRAERPHRIGDAVGVSVLLDLSRGLTPDPPAPGRLRHGPERLQDIAGAVGFDGHAGGASLPGQGPHDLPIGGAEVGVGL